MITWPFFFLLCSRFLTALTVIMCVSVPFGFNNFYSLFHPVKCLEYVCRFLSVIVTFSGISNSCKWEIEYTVSISTMLTFVLKLTLFVSLVYIFSSILYKLNVFTFCVNTVSTNGDALRCRKLFSLNIVLFLNCLYFLFFNNVHPFLLYINTYALLSCFWNRRNSSILGGLFFFILFRVF